MIDHTKTQIDDENYPIKPSSLATFLQDDIDPKQEGHHLLLLPFLTTMDRLRLSECSRRLLDYRYHLTKVKVIPHPTPTSGKRMGMAQLMSNQRQLECLAVGHSSVLHLLDLASWGWFDGLKTLDLSDMEVGEEARDHLRMMRGDYSSHVTNFLKRGRVEGLEELNLTACRLHKGAEEVVGLLKEGVCPQLRRLSLSGNGAFGTFVAGVLESDHLHHLEELDLSFGLICQPDGGATIARALKAARCPQLIKLDLSYCRLNAVIGQALGEAMRSGAYVKLEQLGLGRNGEMGEEGFMAILGALEAGSCPSLKHLDLDKASLRVPSATSLGHALRSGHCRQLQRLLLSSAVEDRDAYLCVLEAIQQGGRGGALPHLTQLFMNGNNMDQEHGRVLGEVIGGGALPKLVVLSVGENQLLGDGGVVPILAGLEGAGCPHLKELHVDDVGMGPQGGLALARALASGHLSCLSFLNAQLNHGIGDEAMAVVVKGLTACRRVRKLNLYNMGMGVMAGRALVQALHDVAWPGLEGLFVGSNQHLLSEEEVVGGLLEVLEKQRGRSSTLPRWRETDLDDETGLNKEGEAGRRLSWFLDGGKEAGP